MVGGPGVRFVFEAGFLVLLAVAAGFAELPPRTIVLVMAGAWLLVALIEWLAWREGPPVQRTARGQGAVQAPEQSAEPVAPADAEPVKPPRRRFWRRRPVEEASAVNGGAPAAAARGEDTEDLGPVPGHTAVARPDDRAEA